MCKQHRKKPTPATMSAFAAAILSGEIDAAADSEWFDRHPGEYMRTRLCSRYELIFSGCLPGATVDVYRLPSGVQFRVIPETSGNMN